jgi:hypothetical protein
MLLLAFCRLSGLCCVHGQHIAFFHEAHEALIEHLLLLLPPMLHLLLLLLLLLLPLRLLPYIQRGPASHRRSSRQQ